METKFEHLDRLLHETIVELNFTKIDGTVRNMKCTLRADLLPPIDETKPIKERKKNETIQTVFDLDKKELRSFRKDSLLDFKVYVVTPLDITESK